MVYIQPNRGKTYNKIVGSFFIVVVLTMIISGIYINHKNKLIDLNYQFNGKVDSANYNIKGEATVIIKGIKYDLSDFNWDFDHNRIQKGDSIVKEKNSMIIKLIKPNGKIIVEGEN